MRLPLKQKLKTKSGKIDKIRYRSKKSHKTYMKKLKDMFLKDNHIVQMTLKEFINHFHQDLSDPTSALIASEETIHIMKKEHKTKISTSIEMV